MSLRLVAFFMASFFTACASLQQHQVPSEKEFSVPTELANKFAVQGEVAAPVQPSPVPQPASAPVKETKTDKVEPSAKKGKKEGKVSAKQEAWPNRWTMKPFFRSGERYLFDITYFGATAGQLELSILPQKIVAGRPSYHFKGRAWTSSIFSLFYRLNDVAESYMDAEGLFSHKFSLKLDESKQQREILELYDQKAHKVYYWSKLDHVKKGKRLDQFEFEIEPYAQDGVSSFFYVRTLPLEIGKTYTFPLVNNGKMREVRVTAIRKEKLPTKIGEIDAIVVKPEVLLDGVLKSYGDSFLWISDDERRLLLKIDAKIKVGSVIAYLREHGYEGKEPASR